MAGRKKESVSGASKNETNNHMCATASGAIFFFIYLYQQEFCGSLNYSDALSDRDNPRAMYFLLQKDN